MQHPTRERTSSVPGRRSFLFRAATLSGAAVALLGTRPRLAASATARPESDVRILATALAAERDAVAAYQAGADSGLLSTDTGRVALKFQDHHRQHADLLAATIRKLGGDVPEPPRDHGLPLDSLTSEQRILEFAAGLERGAVSAYAGAIPLFDDRALSQAAASILADEAMHWAVLRQALSLDPVPGAFFS